MLAHADVFDRDESHHCPRDHIASAGPAREREHKIRLPLREHLRVTPPPRTSPVPPPIGFEQPVLNITTSQDQRVSPSTRSPVRAGCAAFDHDETLIMQGVLVIQSGVYEPSLLIVPASADKHTERVTQDYWPCFGIGLMPCFACPVVL
jgi:hypothetical protein